MKPEDFVTRWLSEGEAEPLLRFSEQSLTGVKLPEESRRFLLEAGLPGSAAPFLNFEVPEGTLPTVSKSWRLPDEFRRYRIVGFNGSGDPICLDESASGAVCYLNHDNRFERVVMSSSVPQLAASLLVFRSFVEGGVSAQSEAQCVELLARIDTNAWEQSAFWREEVLMMKG